MITELKNWWFAYRGNRKLSQLKEIDKWCGYIVDSLVQRQQHFDSNTYVEGCYKSIDNTLGNGLGVCIRVYHGTWAGEYIMKEHAKTLLQGCVETAENRLGKELNKEFKDIEL